MIYLFIFTRFVHSCWSKNISYVDPNLKEANFEFNSIIINTNTTSLFTISIMVIMVIRIESERQQCEEFHLHLWVTLEVLPFQLGLHLRSWHCIGIVISYRECI